MGKSIEGQTGKIRITVPIRNEPILALDGGSVAGPGINSQPIIELGANAQCFLRMQTGAEIDLPSIGCYYFDTDLGYSINWNGTIWVDSTGTPV